MKTEQKEGVLITFFVIFVLAVFALEANSPYGFSLLSYICFDGFQVSCNPGPINHNLDPLLNKYAARDCPYGTEQILSFCVDFKTMLLMALPIFLYGILRALGIIGRLFPFEKKLFQFMSNNKSDGAL